MPRLRRRQDGRDALHRRGTPPLPQGVCANQPCSCDAHPLAGTRVNVAQTGVEQWAFAPEDSTVDDFRPEVVFVTVIGTNAAGLSSTAHSDGILVRHTSCLRPACDLTPAARACVLTLGALCAAG